MLHTILTLTRPLIIFDLETTGIGPDARIVEIGFQRYTAEGMDKEWRSFINPGIPIPPETTEAHHITDEDVANAPLWDEKLARNIARGFSGVDLGGKHIWFDIRVLMADCQRVGVDWSPRGSYILDAEALERIIEPRDLSTLYKRRTGKEPQNAHSALDDVWMTVELIVAQLEQAPDILPRDMEALHALQWPDRIDLDGKFRFDKSGVPHVQFGQHRGKPMRNVPKDYYRWMSRGDFSSEVKQIAQNAIEGRFPIKGDY
jgi:DNA polymerase-3 subunit epsilon